MSLRKVLLIRHGQTDFNTERRLQGAMSVPLNHRGRQQSLALARYLRTQDIDALYTSPRRRAYDTAQIIAETLELTLIEDDRLAEIAFGDFEGLTFPQVARRFPEAYRKWESGYRPYRVPQGESRLDVQWRMQAAWEDIVSAAGHSTVAIVGHSSAMMILLASMFAFLPDKRVSNTSITTLERYDEIWRIASFAESPHLIP